MANPQRQRPQHKRFRPLALVAVVVAALGSLSVWATWYGEQVVLPRYCADPAGTLEHLQRVLTETRPAGDDARRPYLVAARLLFLLPRESDEDVPDYLVRVEAHLEQACP